MKDSVGALSQGLATDPMEGLMPCSFLRPASVTRTVMPGVIVVPHGATARIDEETGVDLAGADNMLTTSNRTTTPFLNGWNSNLVQYEKYDGPINLKPDCEVGPVVPTVE